jgi:hypothetical protein
VDPAATVSGVGALMLPVVAIVTAAPPDRAALLRVTVQFAGAPGPSEVGLHVFETTVMAGSTRAAPVVLAPTKVPSGALPIAPPAPIPIAAVPETVPVIVAITPFAIAVVFIPLATQVYPPETGAQFSVLPAAVNAAPALTATFVRLVG